MGMTSLTCRRFRLWALAFAALLGIFTPHAGAHPHVWIAYSATAQMRGNTLIAVQETWTFSKGFPFSLVGDFSDAPTSGPLDAKHTAIVWKQTFAPLKGADYFTHVFVDGKPVGLADARDFSVAIENRQMVYRFVVPLAVPADVRRAAVEVGVWDETFFVDFEGVNAHPLAVDAAAPKACRALTFEDRQHPIYYGTIFPVSSKLSC
jgi:ABC-type uncharacterized transport system substrate-binding protein